jgi:hypothetical protein
MPTLDELRALGNVEIRILDRLDGWKPLDWERGLLIVHAPWSGPSCHQMKLLVDVLRQHPVSHFLIYVVSSDNLSDEAVARLPRVPHGYGDVIPFSGSQFVEQIDSRDIAEMNQLFNFIKDYGSSTY